MIERSDIWGKTEESSTEKGEEELGIELNIESKYSEGIQVFLKSQFLLSLFTSSFSLSLSRGRFLIFILQAYVEVIEMCAQRFQSVINRNYSYRLLSPTFSFRRQFKWNRHHLKKSNTDKTLLFFNHYNQIQSINFFFFLPCTENSECVFRRYFFSKFPKLIKIQFYCSLLSG